LRKWRQLGPEPTTAERDLVSAQYFLACDLYERLESRVGEDGFGEITTALLERTPKYDGARAKRPPKPDWREWLDAVEELGMIPNGFVPSTVVEDELVEAGVARRGQLAGRLRARTEYHRFLSGSRAGFMPVVVRDLMDAWSFRQARAGITLANEIMATAEIYDRTQDAGTSPLIGQRLAEVSDLKALRRLRRAVAADPAAVAGVPSAE
jgi:hypothetical protein